jgi:hypothetical protein
VISHRDPADEGVGETGETAPALTQVVVGRDKSLTKSSRQMRSIRPEKPAKMDDSDAAGPSNDGRFGLRPLWREFSMEVRVLSGALEASCSRGDSPSIVVDAVRLASTFRRYSASWRSAEQRAKFRSS